MALRITGAREHNLKGIDVEFGDGLTVVTGVSGSGKTSLVFDTLYHEARRRFMEVFSADHIGPRPPPVRVDSIDGLGPAIAVAQDLLNRNPNSTLATASGLHPFFRLLYARFGERYCPRCGSGLAVLSEDEILERLVTLAGEGATEFWVPVLRRVKGSHRTLLRTLAHAFGSEALCVDGGPWQPQSLEADAPHDLEIQVAELAGGVSVAQIREAIRLAAALGVYAVTARQGDNQVTLSQAPLCVGCGRWFNDLEPVHFHSPCPHCQGEGCEPCEGTGLHPEAAAVLWSGLRLPELLAQPVDEVARLTAEATWVTSAARLRNEVGRRLEALQRVGLGYVALDRPSPTLSRGEAQRVRLAVALTGRLEDMLYVLDEPTIGQHPADIAHLLPAFRELAGPVVYVEHDRVAAAAADRAIDLGPGAGNAGGRLLFSGTPAELWQADTATGHYFSMRDRVPTPAPRPGPDRFLTVRGANLRNLQSIDVPIPLGRLSVITGVSGSGKSTLVEDVLVASLQAGEPQGCRAVEGPALKPIIVDQNPIGRNPRSNPATFTKLSDIIRDHYAGVTGLSASHFSFNRPEGACPVCNGMGAIEVQMRYLPSTWIRCAACDGLRFSDEVLSARAFFGSQELSIADLYRLSVAEATPLLLNATGLTDGQRRRLRRTLNALHDVGLGYLPLGQASPTLSGGEAQRVKLAKHLGRASLSKRLLVLDEPTTGLHPQDVTGLLIVLDRLVRAGGTVVVVEHNTDLIRAADWVLDLGPGAGPAGGRLLYAGPPAGLTAVERSLTGQALRAEADVQPRSEPASNGKARSDSISIHGARAHNLKDVDVTFLKRALTVVTGLSGSGKSSLVGDVLEAEARRRFLESLSMYERQGVREGPEAPVDSVGGLGVALAVGTERGRYDLRSTVGTATEVSHHLAALIAWLGERRCLACGADMARVPALHTSTEWLCPACGAAVAVAAPRFFLASTYGAACQKCNGVGTLPRPNPDKLIIQPDKPLCGGAMYSPGFFPKGYLCKPFNGGYDMVQALAARYDFDPGTTPWNRMSPAAKRAFLYGDPEPMEVTYRSRTGRITTRVQRFPGFYGWIRDWDVGGTYTDATVCPDCGGARLRPDYLAVSLGDKNIYELSEMPLRGLLELLEGVPLPRNLDLVGGSLRIIHRRLAFLVQIGLGYLHLNRVTATLSAGEAQRIRLAGLLGSGMTSLTILLDEPTRGLHPSEVEALVAALRSLRDEGNTVIVVEHDPVLIRAADRLIDLGPGSGVQGGEIVAQGDPDAVAAANTPTGRWLRGEGQGSVKRARREPSDWLTIRGARSNNLVGDDVRLPRQVLVGLCGVSGSGKSSLVIDTLGRALAPKRQTTSVAYEPVEPGLHDAIEGAPARTILIDQARAGVRNPLDFLGLRRPIHALYGASSDAQALGLDAKQLGEPCTACSGAGSNRIDLGFLPDVHILCETCRGSGYRPEAWEVSLKGVALPELGRLTLDQVFDLFGGEERLAKPLTAARQVGLGYLVLRQPEFALSGGEAQRLKIAKELARESAGRRRSTETLFVLDEPTVGQHLEDVARLIEVLHTLVDVGHSVVVVEHHAHLLAACDWLIELGPGGGPDGGRVIASGPPDLLASGTTPTAPYLREVLGVER
jgi:excinuclease ABC subunit A